MSKILQQNAQNAQKLYRRVASRTRISRIIASVSRVRIVISRWRVNDSRQETIIRIVPSALENYLPRSASRVTSQLPALAVPNTSHSKSVTGTMIVLCVTNVIRLSLAVVFSQTPWTFCVQIVDEHRPQTFLKFARIKKITERSFVCFKSNHI